MSNLYLGQACRLSEEVHVSLEACHKRYLLGLVLEQQYRLSEKAHASIQVCHKQYVLALKL